MQRGMAREAYPARHPITPATLRQRWKVTPFKKPIEKKKHENVVNATAQREGSFPV